MNLLFANLRRSQKGFTLMEVIAVIVIIGVIGAVAAPKFLELKEGAEDKAALQAIYEARSRLTAQHAIKMMTAESEAKDLAAVVAAVSTDAGDYTLSFSVAGSEVEITARGVKARGVYGKAKGSWMASN